MRKKCGKIFPWKEKNCGEIFPWKENFYAYYG